MSLGSARSKKLIKLFCRIDRKKNNLFKVKLCGTLYHHIKKYILLIFCIILIKRLSILGLDYFWTEY
ncbi:MULTISPECIES: hypothetical protein [Borreliella]|uniref:hypothetical protein n=1 Tax=Borreliella TaxID=64895 RepID=UPI0015751F80